MAKEKQKKISWPQKMQKNYHGKKMQKNIMAKIKQNFAICGGVPSRSQPGLYTQNVHAVISLTFFNSNIWLMNRFFLCIINLDKKNNPFCFSTLIQSKSPSKAVLGSQEEIWEFPTTACSSTCTGVMAPLGLALSTP